jgi:hypothetical protein
MLPSIPDLSTIDPMVFAVIGIALGAYVLWFLWTVMSFEFSGEEHVQLRRGKATTER